MFKNAMLVNLILLFIAVLWGVGFIPQRLGMEYLQVYAFNGWRFILGALTLLPVLFFIGQLNFKAMFNKSTVLTGFVLGCLLFGGVTFQQIGIKYTTLANVAFITGLYAIMVPILGYFLGHRYAKVVWFGGVLAITGLYLMTGVDGQFSFKGDAAVLLGALFWAIHLLLLSEVVGKHQALVLAFYQFLFCALFSFIFAVAFEAKVIPDNSNIYVLLFFSGVIVVGVAYTLHVMIMDSAEPFLAALVLSLESVFGGLAGYFYFGETLSQVAIIGAVLIFTGCLLAQLPGSERERVISK